MNESSGFKKFIEERGNHLVKGTKRDGAIVSLNEELLIHEFENGLDVADGCGIRGLDEVFSWKRGFQNCWTGYPNDGKTQFALYVKVIKALKSDWKWVIWSPEMKSASFTNNQVEVHYNDLINQIIWTISGLTPYRHYSEKYKLERITIKDYLGFLPWIRDHFIMIDPKDKTPEGINKELLRIYEIEGFDGVLIDPFKNIQQDINMRSDIYLDQLFSRYKDFAIETNCSMNWIAHPKANIERIKKTGGTEVLMPCDQYKLNGGAAWDNGMDGIYSIFRHNLLEDVRSKDVTFLNLKQRKQELTTERGNMDSIVFDIKRRRYYFNNYCPILNTNIHVQDDPF